MKLSNRMLVVAIAAGATCAASAIAACSSASSGPGFTGGNDASTGGDTGSSTSTQPGSCANPTVPIIFAPMFSAFIPGSTAQTFQIPAVTADGNSATWSLSDPSQANLQAQSFPVGDTTQPGVMITVAGTGPVTVIATESGGACGSSLLTITTNTENDWTIGNARYNDGVSLHVGPPAGFEGGVPNFDGGFPEGGFQHGDGGGGGGGGGFMTTDGGSFFEEDGGTACTSCHSQNPSQPIFKDVSHTPEQTGGFSDTDLQNIILSGEVPDGGYFDPSVLDGFLHQTCDDAGTNVSPAWSECAQKAYAAWHSLHQWTDIQPDQLPGVICYLRAIAPASQNGSSNFGGGHHGDGGAHGGPPPATDAGTGGD